MWDAVLRFNLGRLWKLVLRNTELVSRLQLAEQLRTGGIRASLAHDAVSTSRFQLTWRYDSLCKGQ